MDVLVCGNYYLEKTAQQEFEADTSWQEEFQLD
jgi:hypothetical protein